MAPEDKALVERIQAGDVEALRGLYRQHQPDLSRFLDRLALPPTTVESIVCDAFTMLREKQISLEGTDRLDVLFYRTA